MFGGSLGVLGVWAGGVVFCWLLGFACYWMYVLCFRVLIEYVLHMCPVL